MFGFRLYLELVSANIRSQMQYKISFILQIIGQAIVTGVDFIAILFIFTKFDHIKGWKLVEVALLYSMTTMSFAISEIIGRGFHTFDKMVRRGNFDRVLLRPVGICFQLLASETIMRKLGRFFQGAAVFVIAWHKLGLGMDIVKLTFLSVTIVSGAVFYTAIIIAGATICFWTVQSAELPNMLTYGGVEALSYPISVYKEWFRDVFIYIIPMAFINYFPSLYLLDKIDPLGLPSFLRFISPIVSMAMMVLALRFWNYGVRHYQSTGS